MIADALRTAYIEASRAFRISQAAKNAEWYEGQAEKARAQLDEAEKIKTAYEKENNVILGSQDTDVDSARLQAMAGQTAMPAPVFSTPTPSPAAPNWRRSTPPSPRSRRSLAPTTPSFRPCATSAPSLAQQVLQDQAASTPPRGPRPAPRRRYRRHGAGHVGATGPGHGPTRQAGEAASAARRRGAAPRPLHQDRRTGAPSSGTKPPRR